MNVHQIQHNDDVPSDSGRWKNVLFTVAVTAAFALGVYSLFLASANADKAGPSDITGLVRTATPADAGKIEVALGAPAGQDLVYVVLYDAEVGLDAEVEIAARRAARSIAESGIAVSVRLLGPGDADFATIASQNGVVRFPAVLAVKRDGGIVLVTDDINEKTLLDVYEAVWGKKSSCDDAGSGVY